MPVGKKGIFPILLCALLSAGLPAPALSQKPACPESQDYKKLRYDEDYGYLRDPACRTGALDALKFIPLHRKGEWYLSLGGETRQTVEYFRNPTWGQEPQGHAYLLQRYMGHADLHVGKRMRLFVQIKSGLENGRAGGPRPIDEDKLDLNQAFVDVGLLLQDHHSITLRLGRQELALGDDRFVSVREGPNVHQTFDGVRWILTAGAWRVDALATKPVRTKVGFFDDSPDPGRTFWGVYAVRPLPGLRGGKIDLYYLGLDRKQGRFDQGAGAEIRHSLGTRISGVRGAWNYNVEPIYQWGGFGRAVIRAWSVESDTGYTLSAARLHPRIGLKADIASGDRDRTNPNLQTFNPLFPRGIFNQLVNLNGHVNFIDLDPSLALHVTRQWSLTPDWDFFWRQSVGDGLYGVGGNLLRSGKMSRARYIGSQPSLVVSGRLNRHFTIILIYTHFFPGPFLRETGTARNVNYVTGWLGFKF